MGKPVRIMVAQDFPELREQLRLHLEKEGFQVLLANDGGEALALIEHPDGLSLVITDINLPGFSGFEVAEHARARHPTIPIIFVTGHPEQVERSGISAPMRCLAKPIRPALLSEAMTQLLGLAFDRRTTA